MPANQDLLAWLRTICGEFQLDVAAIYTRNGEHNWPFTAKDEDDLEQQLEAGGHFLPLPSEPAALANVLEVALVDYVEERASQEPEIEFTRGTERGYPDIELSGGRFGGGFHAVDIKVARRAESGSQTQSRITLYTGNTYFRYPKLQWPGTFRAFNEYESHVDLLGIYTRDLDSLARITDLEIIVAEPWRIASRQRSSTTREYIGAVMAIEALRNGAGEFKTEADFYAFWRKFPFKIGAVVQRQLDRLLNQDES